MYRNSPLHDFLYLSNKYILRGIDILFVGSYYMCRYTYALIVQYICSTCTHHPPSWIFTIIVSYDGNLLQALCINYRKFSRRPHYKNSRNLHLSRLYLTFITAGFQRRGTNQKIKSFSFTIIKVLKQRYSNILLLKNYNWKCNFCVSI